MIVSLSVTQQVRRVLITGWKIENKISYLLVESHLNYDHAFLDQSKETCLLDVTGRSFLDGIRIKSYWTACTVGEETLNFLYGEWAGRN